MYILSMEVAAAIWTNIGLLKELGFFVICFNSEGTAQKVQLVNYTLWTL